MLPTAEKSQYPLSDENLTLLRGYSSRSPMSFKKIHFRFDRIFIKGAKFDCLKTFTFVDLSRKLIKTKDKRIEYSRFSSNKYRKTIE